MQKTPIESNPAHPHSFEVIVIGGGHAGIEAALASARLGRKTLMLAIDLDSIGYLACNPSIGGTAKGHLVKEIDALGGRMGLEADKALIQLRMLNASKGVAVHSLRAQIDKNLYHRNIKLALELADNLTLRQGEVSELLAEDINSVNGTKKRITGVRTVLGETFLAPCVIAAVGVYLKSQIIIGGTVQDAGPAGFRRASKLSDSINELGHITRRFKTGTPARIDGRSVDYSRLEIQDGEDTYPFSYLSKRVKYNRAPCYLGYTNPRTHQIIRDNLHLSPVYSGLIQGTGARYCPSIEDKIVRFGDKERHQFFLEPEGLDTNEVYVQGISTSLPPEVQIQILRSIEGLENVRIMRDAYAIEYDCIDTLTLNSALESKLVDGLYFAGQINGTSGYEEAAAQGLLAGINAARSLDGLPPVILERSRSYIGVLIDDLVTKGTNEPYRMMTSRAEYRLRLRQSNSDLRLTPIAIEIGMAEEGRKKAFLRKLKLLKRLRSLLGESVPKAEAQAVLTQCNGQDLEGGITLEQLFKRNNLSSAVCKKHLEILAPFPPDVVEEVLNGCLYEGYLAREERAVREAAKLESMLIPEDFDYTAYKGLRIEAAAKLSKIRPRTIGQASRISGVNPADINVLILLLAKR